MYFIDENGSLYFEIYMYIYIYSSIDFDFDKLPMVIEAWFW